MPDQNINQTVPPANTSQVASAGINQTGQILTPNTDNKLSSSPKKLIAITAGIIVLVIGLVAGVILVRQPQDTRSLATVNDPCIQSISYTINGTVFSTLRDNVNQGNMVVATFQVPQGCQPTEVTLVAYQAPDSTFDRQTAHLQTLFDADTSTFSPGNHSLQVTIPSCYFQVDFAKGPVIETLGPADTTNFYGDQNRLIDYDNGGTNTCVSITNTPTPIPTNTTTPVPSTTITPPVPSATPTPETAASCNSVIIYDTDWNVLSQSDLDGLQPGDVVRLSVSGNSSQGNFDAARFTVNGITRPQVSNVKPGTNEFYEEYTIPNAVSNFTVTGEVHHSTLGWI